MLRKLVTALLGIHDILDKMYFNYNLSSVITLFDGDSREFKQLIKVEKYGVLSGKQGHEISMLAYIACKSLMGVFIKRYLDKQMRQK